ncbi:unnamed protein product, partial [Rhizoctonia solani]
MSFIMDYNIHIDPQRDGAQPGPHKLHEDVPFDAAGFNAAVLGAIEQYKSLSADDPPPFDTNDELTPDEHILLYLVIRTFIPESQMDESTCDRHLKLRQNRLLPGALRTAYTSHNYASLLSLDAMPDHVKERASKQGQDTTLSTSGGLQDLQHSPALSFRSLFKAPYIGDTAKLLIETLNHEREMYLQNNA